jgi:hypothetical protein
VIGKRSGSACPRREDLLRLLRWAVHLALDWGSGFLQLLRAASVCRFRQLLSFRNLFSCTFRRRGTPGRLSWSRRSPPKSSRSCARRSGGDLYVAQNHPQLLRRESARPKLRNSVLLHTFALRAWLVCFGCGEYASVFPHVNLVQLISIEPKGGESCQRSLNTERS